MSAFKPSVDIEFAVVDERERAAKRQQSKGSSRSAHKDKDNEAKLVSTGKAGDRSRGAERKEGERPRSAVAKKIAKKVSIAPAPSDGAHYEIGMDKESSDNNRVSSASAAAEAKESGSTGQGQGVQARKEDKERDKALVGVVPLRPSGGVAATKVMYSNSRVRSAPNHQKTTPTACSTSSQVRNNNSGSSSGAAPSSSSSDKMIGANNNDSGNVPKPRARLDNGAWDMNIQPPDRDELIARTDNEIFKKRMDKLDRDQERAHKDNPNDAPSSSSGTNNQNQNQVGGIDSASSGNGNGSGSGGNSNGIPIPRTCRGSAGAGQSEIFNPQRIRPCKAVSGTNGAKGGVLNVTYGGGRTTYAVTKLQEQTIPGRPVSFTPQKVKSPPSASVGSSSSADASGAAAIVAEKEASRLRRVASSLSGAMGTTKSYGIHSCGWDKGELTVEQLEKGLRLVPEPANRMVPINTTGSQNPNRCTRPPREYVSSTQVQKGGWGAVDKQRSLSEMPGY